MIRIHMYLHALENNVLTRPITFITEAKYVYNIFIYMRCMSVNGLRKPYILLVYDEVTKV